ncbi:hypothetical protein [Psychromonas ossibalaenae]|uniref:hypothetical protein n=1 Tax=Psychromonas ossibalaenae TaxID=444922 RepID=UPI000371BE21|nr:hypothetical protein [Psychromonas ossibalaenae]
MKKSIIALSVILGAAQLSGCNSSDEIKAEIKKQLGFSMEDGAQEIKSGYLPFRFAVVNGREDDVTVKMHYKVEANANQISQDLTQITNLNKLIRNEVLDIEIIDDMIIGEDYSIQVRPENIKKDFELTINEGLLANNDKWSTLFNQTQSDFSYYVVLHEETDHPTETTHSPVVKMAVKKADLKKSTAGFINRISTSNFSAADSNICVIASTNKGNTLISADLPYNSSSAMFAMDKVLNTDQQDYRFIIVANASMQELEEHNQDKLSNSEMDYAQQHCRINGKSDKENYWVAVSDEKIEDMPEENLAIILSVDHSEGKRELAVDGIELPSLKWEKETWK